MAKQKKRGFFSWLGFGEKEQETEQKTEEQQVVEEPSQPETPVETAAVVEAEEPAHSKEEIESFAEEVVEVTEQVQESEKPEPVIVETLNEAPQATIEHEELPLPEEVKAEEVSAEEWQAEAETVEIVEAVEEEAALEPELTDEELEAQALAAEAAEEAVIVVPVEAQAEEEIVQEQEKPTKEGFFARLKRSLLKTKENLGSGFISLFRGKKIDDDLFEELEIWNDEKYRNLQGTYPVISLSFANVKEPTYQLAEKKICELIAQLYVKYDFITESGKLRDTEVKLYKKIMTDMEYVDATLSLYYLSGFLYKYYGKKVIILLDEYDTPM